MNPWRVPLFLIITFSVLLSGCFRMSTVTMKADVLIIGIEQGNGPSFSKQMRRLNTFEWHVPASGQATSLNVEDAIKINGDAPRRLGEGAVEGKITRVVDKVWVFGPSRLKGSFIVTDEYVVVDLGEESPLSGTYERRFDATAK